MPIPDGFVIGAEVQEDINLKSCARCGERKPVTHYHKDAGKKDGLRAYCKPCALNYSANYYKANTPDVLARHATYYSENRERATAKNLRWAAANPDKMRAFNAKWRNANPDKVRAAKARWRAQNPDAIRIKNQNRRARESGGSLSKGLSARLFTLQKGKCACCRKPLGDKYHLDHIMPLALGGTNTDNNMQLLRAVCNHQKYTKHPVEFMQQRGFLL